MIRDLTGQKFGKLTPIKIVNAPRADLKGTYWKCNCECGNVKVIRSNAITSGGTVSCGCHRELNSVIVNHKGYGVSAMNTLKRRYRIEAAQRGFVFELSDYFFSMIIKENCTYCGSPPSNKAVSKGGCIIYNGIDRVENTIGYIESNVQPCCGVCNRLKYKDSLIDFKNYIKRAYLHLVETNQIDS